MKRTLLIVAIALSSLLTSSCIAISEYEKLEHSNQVLRRDYNANIVELADMREENAELQRQNQSLNSRITELTDKQATFDDTIANLKREMANMKMGFDTVVENYAQRLTGQTRDLKRTNNLLAVRNDEINQKEAAFQKKEAAFLRKEAAFLEKEAAFIQKEKMFQQKQELLEKQEAAARQALKEKEKELENLRSSLNNALVGFANKGLNVETRNGKVYVSLDSKLLFQSGKWTVSKEGVEAIKTLAKVLESNTELNILVEGHTDNDAYKGNSSVKDNWDLSVMRATAIVKLLLEHGPSIDPARIEACGHGEFAPKVPNDTPTNKALNRRTEIILTPKMTDILKMIE